MSHALVLSMQHPYERLGLPMPVGRRLFAMTKVTWLMVIGILLGTAIGVYMYEVNTVAGRNFELRSLEKRADRLQENISSLEDKVAEMQSMQTLQGRLAELGYVPVAKLEFLEPARGAYALAK